LQRLIDGQDQNTYGIIDGSIPQRAREIVLSDFLDKKRRVIYGNIRDCSVGINELVSASTAIYYSTGVNLEDWLQSRDRLHRMGQKNKVTLYVLLATDTVDEAIYKKLKDKTQVAGKIVSLDYARSLLS